MGTGWRVACSSALGEACHHCSYFSPHSFGRVIASLRAILRLAATEEAQMAGLALMPRYQKLAEVWMDSEPECGLIIFSCSKPADQWVTAPDPSGSVVMPGGLCSGAPPSPLPKFTRKCTSHDATYTPHNASVLPNPQRNSLHSPKCIDT